MKATFHSERNMKFHICAAIIALACSLWLQISMERFMLVLLAITLVISAELMNTAVEKAVDLAMPDQHPLAKAAKDAAAGAVLVTAVFAIAVAIYVFYKPFIALLM